MDPLWAIISSPSSSKYEVTPKASGKRFQMNEMALYTVESGKIVHKHFFYNAGG